MERISIVHIKKGRKGRLGYITTIAEHHFAITPCKVDAVVYFSIPGIDEDFLQVLAEPWDVKQEPQEAAIERGTKKLVDSSPAQWIDTYEATTLQTVRDKKLKYHRDYLLALLGAYKCYFNKDWKPNEKSNNE